MTSSCLLLLPLSPSPLFLSLPPFLYLFLFEIDGICTFSFLSHMTAEGWSKFRRQKHQGQYETSVFRAKDLYLLDLEWSSYETCLTNQKAEVVSWKAGRLFPVKSSDTRHYWQMSKTNYLSDFCLCCFYLHTDCIIAVTALWCSPVGLPIVWFSYFHLPVCPALLCISFSMSLSLLLRLSFPSCPMCLFLFLIYLS